MHTFVRRIVIASCLIPFVVAGCTQPAKRSVQYIKHRQQEAADVAMIQRHCPFGQPKADPFWQHGDTLVVTRLGYALLHSSQDRIPLWVCEYIPKAQLEGDVTRPKPDDKYFKADPELPSGKRAERSDYRGSGYDRGHQAPAGDQTTSFERKIETYYLSNIAPQIGDGFNRHIWANLEEEARTWIKSRGEGYIVTGPMFWDPTEEDGSGDGWVNYSVIGDNEVAVPTHFFKIVVSRSGASGPWQAIAFVLPNKKHPSGHHLASDIKSIDWIEQRTGFDFMPDLAPDEERRLERDPSPMWN